MSNLEPRIEAVRAKYDLSVDDFWQIKQNKQWVCKHAALEIVAVKAKIEWLPPQIIEANAPALVTSMIVTGRMGDRVEWATGETNQTNYSVSGKQPAYPWAMSEKRAKDRVVLKLVGIHGLVYSEDEMPSVSAQETPTASKNDAARETFTRLQKDFRTIKDTDKLKLWWRDNADDIGSLPVDWGKNIRSEWIAHGVSLKQAQDTVSEIQEQFPGAKVVGDKFVERFVSGEPFVSSEEDFKNGGNALEADNNG